MNRALFILAILSFCHYVCRGQNNFACDSANTFSIVEEMPEFPEGDGAMIKYISQNIKIKNPEKDTNFPPSTFYIDFLVDKSGMAHFIQIKPEGYLENIEDTFKRMPAWKPGKQNGKEVCLKFIIPLRVDYK